MRYIIIVLVVFALFWLGRYLYFKPKFIQGERAPQFEVVMINGERVALKDLEGQYVLIDFWGSWCGPCRRENPELVALYRTFSGKEFTIVSIGLETNESSWRTAIERDGLNWPYHYAEFNRMDNSIGKLYGVREIPTKYLINPDGYIMGVNQEVEEIHEILSERL